MALAFNFGRPGRDAPQDEYQMFIGCLERHTPETAWPKDHMQRNYVACAWVTSFRSVSSNSVD